MDFYYNIMSPPCQSVIFLAKKLDLKLNLKKTNTQDAAEKEALTKLNPQHTIPTLVDHGHVVWESYAILIYLVEKYAKNDSLYPKDPKVRSVVNQRLFFDIGTFYKNLIAVVHVQMRKETVTDEMQERLKSSVDLLETFLSTQRYVAADHLTIADIPLLNSCLSLSWANFNLTPYPKIQAWIARVSSELPDFASIREEVTAAIKVYFASKQ